MADLDRMMTLALALMSVTSRGALHPTDTESILHRSRAGAVLLLVAGAWTAFKAQALPVAPELTGEGSRGGVLSRRGTATTGGNWVAGKISHLSVCKHRCA